MAFAAQRGEDSKVALQYGQGPEADDGSGMDCKHQPSPPIEESKIPPSRSDSPVLFSPRPPRDAVRPSYASMVAGGEKKGAVEPEKRDQKEEKEEREGKEGEVVPEARDGKDEKQEREEPAPESNVGEEVKRETEERMEEQRRRDGGVIPTPQQIADHPGLYANVPHSLWRKWCDLMGADLSRYLKLSSGARTPESERERALVIVSLFRKPLALRRVRGGKGHRKEAGLSRQMAEMASRGAVPVLSRPPRFPAVKSEEDRRAMRAAEHVQGMQPGRAAKTLLGGRLAPDDIKTKEKLISKHPQSPPDLSDLVPPKTEFVVIPREIVSKAVRKLNNGSAPGPSGMTGGHLRPLIDDEMCLNGLTALVADIARRDVPAEVMDLVLSAKLVALEKDGADGDVRPIAIEETLLKLVCTVMKMLCKPGFEHKVLNGFEIQKAVGLKGGLETSIHKTQLAIEKGTGKGYVGLAFDFVNAFNSVLRKRVLEKVLGCPELAPLHHLVWLAYSRPTPLVWRLKGRAMCTDDLLSAEGVRQGNCLSALLFALVVEDLYQEALKDLPDCTAVAILDDLTVVGPQEQVFAVFERIRSKCGAIGLSLNLKKTTLFCVDGNVAAANRARELGLSVVEGSTKILGAAVGREDRRQVAVKLCESAIEKHKKLFNGLENKHLSMQEKILILGACALPLMNFAARVNFPGHIAEQLGKFDQQVQASALKAMGISAAECTPAVLTQVKLPVRLGGGGFRSLKDTCNAAWYASQFQARSELNKLVSDDVKVPTKSIATRRGVRKQLASQLGPLAARSLEWNPHKPPQHLQREITRAIEDQKHEQFLQSQPQGSESAVRLQCLQAPGASDWINTYPVDRATTLDDRSYSAAWRIRFGLPSVPWAPVVCTSKCGADLRANPGHVLGCNVQVPRSLKERHDALRRTVARYCRDEAGASVYEEPPSMQQDPGQAAVRTDIVVAMQDVVRTVDISVIHPAQGRFMRSAATKPLVAAESREQAKRKKHAEVAAAAPQQATFVPLVVESYGGLGAEAKAFMKEVAQVVASTSPISESCAYFNLRRRFSIALQRFNASSALHTCNEALSSRRVAPALLAPSALSSVSAESISVLSSGSAARSGVAPVPGPRVPSIPSSSSGFRSPGRG